MLARISRLSKSLAAFPKRHLSASTEGFGDHLFKGVVAESYLKKHGLPTNTLESHAWTQNGNADKVSFTV